MSLKQNIFRSVPFDAATRQGKTCNTLTGTVSRLHLQAVKNKPTHGQAGQVCQKQQGSGTFTAALDVKRSYSLVWKHVLPA